mmetsp:Transcript_41373/g.132140  ORF Transcript_41373/g.132140 Transcript_41373/m.132140 type:complete len:248 (-) Transcript_41373:502-1245(-)
MECVHHAGARLGDPHAEGEHRGALEGKPALRREHDGEPAEGRPLRLPRHLPALLVHDGRAPPRHHFLAPGLPGLIGALEVQLEDEAGGRPDLDPGQAHHLPPRRGPPPRHVVRRRGRADDSPLPRLHGLVALIEHDHDAHVALQPPEGREVFHVDLHYLPLHVLGAPRAVVVAARAGRSLAAHVAVLAALPAPRRAATLSLTLLHNIVAVLRQVVPGLCPAAVPALGVQRGRRTVRLDPGELVAHGV